MKKVLLANLFFVIISFACFSEEYNQMRNFDQYPSKYVLYPTTNNWIFIKLDTETGKLWMIQYSVNDDESRGTFDISTKDLSVNKTRVKGRFKLYPTKNMYTFIMLDTIDGSAYQVQWSTDNNVGVWTIKN